MLLILLYKLNFWIYIKQQKCVEIYQLLPSILPNRTSVYDVRILYVIQG